jgi:hypothetical protein
LISEEESGFILSKFTAGSGQLRAFECQFLPTAKGANSLKMKLFDIVACPKSGLLEYDHTLG